LYLKIVPLVDFWDGWGERNFVVELPDGGHARIPCSWADESLRVPEPIAEAETKLSVASARELIPVLETLRRRTRL
jgi:hypothetical protein